MGGDKRTGLANHPGVVFIGIVASILGIATFITGRHNLSDFLALQRTEELNNGVSAGSSATDPIVPQDPFKIAFSLKTVDGRILGPKDFPGQVIVVDFWATWCG